LRQGLLFCGHDETEYSKNQSIFFKLLKLLADQNAKIEAIVLQNAPNNLKLVTSDIQKYIVHVVTIETTNKIIEELKDKLFFILVDDHYHKHCKERSKIS
jgi:translation initiation factor 2 beta subunit (eIF-2beta)/eIF-5